MILLNALAPLIGHPQNVEYPCTIMGKSSAPVSLVGDNLKRYFDQSPFS